MKTRFGFNFIFLLVIFVVLFTGCGKKDEKLKFTFYPSEGYIVPGSTYSCKGDRFKAPDLPGPYIKFGYKFENISENYLRLVYYNIVGTGNVLGSPFKMTITPDVSVEAATFAPRDTRSVGSGIAAATDDACLDPFSAFNITTGKSGTVTFKWTFQFLIIDPGDATIEIPYNQTVITTGKVLPF